MVISQQLPSGNVSLVCGRKSRVCSQLEEAMLKVRLEDYAMVMRQSPFPLRCQT